MKIKFIFFFALLAISSFTFGQKKATWDNWKLLLGSWEGEGTGQPGQGKGTFSFANDLDKKIIIRKNHNEFPATENKPAFVHDDLMIIYSDMNGSPNQAIYFDNEGHTINYELTYSDKLIVFTSLKTPNVPVFRLTYSIPDKETMNIKFEMSQDGEKFMTYLEGKCKRTN